MVFYLFSMTDLLGALRREGKLMIYARLLLIAKPFVAPRN